MLFNPIRARVTLELYYADYAVKPILTFKSTVDETLVYNHSNENYIEQHFHVVLFILLYKVIQGNTR